MPNNPVSRMERKLMYVLVLLYTFLSTVLSKCQEPSNADEIKLQLQNEIKDTYLNYMSFFSIKSNLEKVLGQLNETFVANSTTPSRGSHLVRLYGESKCKKRRRFRAGQNHTTSEMSSCPWYYVLDFDYDRIPLNVLKARCACTNCLVPMRNGYKRDVKSSGGYCKEVSYHMPVVRRDCVGKEFQYRIAIENVPVGCTCQRCKRKAKRGKRNVELSS